MKPLPLRLSLRRTLLATALAAPFAGLRAQQPPLLPAPRALDEEAAAARAAGRALVVMVSLHGCPYCKEVRESHLVHLRREGQPIVQVDMDSEQALRDFEGKPATHRQLIGAWRVRVAPTLLFFGTGGRQLAPRLAGAGIPDFYGAYLNERLKLANQRATT